MKVSVILGAKGSSRVITLPSTASVADAAATLAQHRIGAILISHGDGGIEGILSERDIVRGLGSEGAGILSHPVSGLMTAQVETCGLEETALAVLGHMTNGRFRHMPVVGADGKLVGILSIGDVVKARLEEIERENAAMTEMLSQ